MRRLALSFLCVACATATPPSVYMTTPPAIPAPRAFVAPAPVRFTLANGLEVALVEKHTAPLVAMTLVVKSGSLADPEGKSGLARLTAALLDEGAGSRDAMALAAAIEDLGASLGATAGPDSSSVALVTVASKVDAASELFADVILRPRFDAKEVERLRADTVSRLIARRAQAGSMAMLAMTAALYGDTGYGRSADGYPATVEKLGADDLRGFWEASYRPNNAVLIVVGDVTAADLKARAEKLFGAWPARPVPAITPPAPRADRPRVVLVDKPGAQQSTVFVAEPVATRASADYAALDSLSTMLGGSFTSRLERNLRERHNYTYSAGAGVSWRRGVGPFFATADIFTANTGAGLTEILHELDAARGPLTDEEFEKATALDRQSLVDDLETAQRTSAVIAGLVATGMSVDDYRELDAKIGGLTAADLTRAAATYIHPERMTIIVVGDLAKIRAEIEGLKLGKIEVRDADGRVL